MTRECFENWKSKKELTRLIETSTMTFYAVDVLFYKKTPDLSIVFLDDGISVTWSDSVGWEWTPSLHEVYEKITRFFPLNEIINVSFIGEY